MDLREHLDDCMIEKLRYVYDDLIADVKYTFEEETSPYDLPRDIESALDYIDLGWIIENHIDGNNYKDELVLGIEDYADNYADCDEVICEYGIIRAIENHYEYGDSLETLTYKILLEDYDYSEGDIYDAIYSEAVEYICDELREWFIEFSTVDANSAMALSILCGKHDIDHVYDEDEKCEYVDIHTYDSFGNSRTVRAVFKLGYRNALHANGLVMYFDHISYDEDEDLLKIYSCTEELLGYLNTTPDVEE